MIEKPYNVMFIPPTSAGGLGKQPMKSRLRTSPTIARYVKRGDVVCRKRN